MQKVSKEYKASMKDSLRERAYIMLSFGLVNQEAQSKAKIDSGDFAYFSNKENLFGQREDDTIYATLESAGFSEAAAQNACRNDISFISLDGKYQAGDAETAAAIGICISAFYKGQIAEAKLFAIKPRGTKRSVSMLNSIGCFAVKRRTVSFASAKIWKPKTIFLPCCS